MIAPRRPRVLLIGARGQIGRAIASAAPAKWLITKVDHSSLDITKKEAVLRYVHKLKPHCILNTAAFTQVDAAELHPEEAFRVNKDGAGHIAEAADVVGARLIHLSTDYVFSGAASRPYRPCDQAEPLGVYGKSKLAGETVMLETLNDQCVILRTAAVHGPDGVNFVRTMLRLMSERNSVSVVSDQVVSPTSVVTLSAALIQIVQNVAISGIHHFTDSGLASWYDFAVAIAEEGVARGLLSHRPEVYPVLYLAQSGKAPRPKYSVLDKSKTWKQLGSTPLHWRDGLRLTLDALQARKRYVEGMTS